MTENEFDTILVKFLLEEPFFATIIRSLRKVRTSEISTAGVAYKGGTFILYWSPEFLSSLSTQKVFGLLKHECYHIIFKHITNRKQTPHKHWNIATDLAINSIIPVKELPNCGLRPGCIPGDLLNKDSKVVLTNAFHNFIRNLPTDKSSEFYMNEILNNPEIYEFLNEICIDEISFDEHDNDSLSDTEIEIANSQIKALVDKAVNVANTRNWGSVSFSTKEQILTLHKEEFDWKKSLKYFCGSKQKNSYFKTQRKINRKYPYIHPGKKDNKTSMLAVYIDQSGSVGDDALNKFGSLLENLSKTHTFTYYFFDTKVDEESKTTWKSGKKSNFKRTLRGGTSFDCVENHFREINKNFDGYIIMTDGQASKPQSSISKRCWVISPGNKIEFTPDKRDFVVYMN
jgi:predicted metal-dependent peptidase